MSLNNQAVSMDVFFEIATSEVDLLIRSDAVAALRHVFAVGGTATPAQLWQLKHVSQVLCLIKILQNPSKLGLTKRPTEAGRWPESCRDRNAKQCLSPSIEPHRKDVDF